MSCHSYFQGLYVFTPNMFTENNNSLLPVSSKVRDSLSIIEIINCVVALLSLQCICICFT